MQDESDKASRPWSMTFRVTGKPRCPGCCVELASVVISFHEGWAWCPVCSHAALHAQVHLRYVLHHHIMERSSIVRHGLRFYMPRLVDNAYRNAIDEYERLLNTPEEAPRALAAWPDFDFIQLPQSVRDRDSKLKVRFCRPVKVPFGYEIAGITDDDRILLLEIKSSEPATEASNLHHTNSDGNHE